MWKIASFRPGDEPFKNLSDALIKNTSLHGDITQKLWERNFSALLQDNPLEEDHNLLILVDQFEELFRYEQRPNTVETFINCLLDCSQCDRVHVAIVLRSEFERDCHQYPVLTEKINEGTTFNVRLFYDDELRDIIRSPANTFGYTGNVEKELVEQIINDAKQNSGDSLALIQQALVSLWPPGADMKKVRLTLKAYQEVGGLQALSRVAEQAFGELNTEKERVAEILFRNLTTFNDGMLNDIPYTRYPMRLEHIAQLLHSDIRAVSEIINVFRQPGRHFLMPMQENKGRLSEGDIIDISHEALIRQWERLKEWAKDERRLTKQYWDLLSKDSFYKAKTGELLRGLDLQNAEQWLKRILSFYPTETQYNLWAERRCRNTKEESVGDFQQVKDESIGDFQRVIAFIEQSRAAEKQAKEIAEKEAKDKQAKENELRARYEELQQQKLENRRKKADALIAFAVAFLLLISTMSFGLLWNEAKKAREAAIAANELAQQAEQYRRQELFESRRTHAALLAQNGDYAGAQSVLKQTYGIEDDSETGKMTRHARDWLAGLIEVMGAEGETLFSEIGKPLLAMAMSPDGVRVAVAGENGVLQLHDAQTGERVRTLSGHERHVNVLVFETPQSLVSAGQDGKIIRHDLLNNTQSVVYEAEYEIFALARTTEWLAAAGASTQIVLLPLAEHAGVSDQKIRSIDSGHDDSIFSLAFDTQGKYLASASADRSVRVWQVADDALVTTLVGHADMVQSIAFHPDGQHLVTGSKDNTLRYWELNTGKSQVCAGHDDAVFSLAFLTPSVLASASADRTIRLWDVDSGQTLRVLQGHTAQVTGLFGKEKENVLLSVSNDGSLRQWPTHSPRQQLLPVAYAASAVAISPDGSFFVSGARTGLLQAYALPSLSPLWQREDIHQAMISRLVFSQKGQLLSADLDGKAVVWQVDKVGLTQLSTLSHEKTIHGASFSIDGQFVIMTSNDGNISVWSVNGEKLQFLEKAHDGIDVNSVFFNSTGEFVLTASDQDVKRWQFQNGQLTLQSRLSEGQDIIWADWNPQSTRYLQTSRNMPVGIFDAQTGEALFSLPGHQDTVRQGFFSPDGYQVITVSQDNTVQFWDLSKKQEEANFFRLTLPLTGEIRHSDLRCVEQTCWLIVPASEQEELTSGAIALYSIKMGQ
ncbi:hypothetical protein TPSD3_01025 [Thioflexithrix psekupsensis]|uniref:Novel STAND NTPase 1 domain-containing protein n=1 Tax=Thioflexithrix psekupsensis TaxID=1570016 RepID=A0A251XCC9_9GAMM|nr:hypothetical protein TPSD3_01025 [Thioflexithrix psekupsensis]